MSRRWLKPTPRRAAWELLLVSIGCAMGLQLAMRHKLDRWTVLPFVLLCYGAVASSLVSCALSWWRGERQLRIASSLSALCMVLMWLSLWFEPLKDLTYWLMRLGYRWLVV